MGAKGPFAGIDEGLHHLFLPQIETLEMAASPRRCGVVSQLAPERGRGSAWMAAIGSDCLMTVLDLSVRGTVDLTSHSPGYLCLGAMSRSSLETMPLPVRPSGAADLVLYRQQPGTYPYRLRAQTTYASRSLCFTPRFLKQLAFEQGEDVEPFLARLSEASQTLASTQLESMLRRLDARSADSTAMGFRLAALRAEALACLLEAIEGDRAAERQQGSRAAAGLAEAARELMARELERPLTLEAIARELCVSRAHLAATYKRETGCSVAADLRRLRMERAAELVSGSNLPLAEVARKVGYPRQSSFTEAFKRAHGFPPAQWRKSHQA